MKNKKYTIHIKDALCSLTWYDLVFLLLFIYLFIFQIHAIWPFTIDDMYISLRYAKHWYAGNGLVWNIHELPVEGYSNFSFVVLALLCMMVHLDPVIILKSAGIIGLFCTSFFVYSIARFWYSWRISLLPCIALLMYKGQIIWAISGLETTIYEALFTASVYFSFKAMGYSWNAPIRVEPLTKFYIISALCLFFAGLTRPEASVFILIFGVLFFIDAINTSGKKSWFGLLYFFLTLLATYLPYFLCRWYYFGYLFPNPVYCKGISDYFFTLDSAYLKMAWPWLILALLAFIRSFDIRYFFLILPSIIYLILLIHADPVVSFANRLFLPAFALILPLSLKGLEFLVGFYTQQKYTKNGLLSFIYTLSIIFLIPGMSLSEYRYFTQSPLAGEKLRFEVVEWLNKHITNKDQIVLGDAGLIPYYTQAPFIDSYCLNNRTMAHDVPGERYDNFCSQVLSLRPAVIILTSLIQGTKLTYTPSDRCLKKLLSKSSEYRLESVFSTKGIESKYRYELFHVTQQVLP